MYETKYVRGAIPFSEFLRYPAESVMYYEILTDDHNAAINSLRKRIYKAKVNITLVFGFLASADWTHTSKEPVFLARVTIIKPSSAKQYCW